MNEGASRLLDAEQEFKTELASNPDEFFANYYLGIVYIFQRKWELAIAFLKNASRVQADNPDPYFQLGQAYQELQKHDQALETLKKAIALNPKEDLAYHVLGIWNREMAELNWMLRTFAELLYGKLPSASLAKAISDLRRATELAPDVVPHHVELGITLKAARQYPEANEQFDKALSLPKSWVTDDYYKELAQANYRK